MSTHNFKSIFLFSHLSHLKHNNFNFINSSKNITKNGKKTNVKKLKK